MTVFSSPDRGLLLLRGYLKYKLPRQRGFLELSEIVVDCCCYFDAAKSGFLKDSCSEYQEQEALVSPGRAIKCTNLRVLRKVKRNFDLAVCMQFFIQLYACILSFSSYIFMLGRHAVSACQLYLLTIWEGTDTSKLFEVLKGLSL